MANLPEGTRREAYKTPKGIVKEYLILDSIKVSITTAGKESEKIVCSAVISEESDEVLINDKLGGRLKIVIEDLGRVYGGSGIKKAKTERKSRLVCLVLF